MNYIDSLVLASREGTARVSGQLIGVFEFMQANWSSLSSASVNDGDAPINFTVALKNRAWLPAQRNPKAIEEFPGFTFQQDRLYRPDEIYPVRLIHQIGSVLPVLATSREVEREVRLALGMPAQAPIEAICRHFDHLLDLWNRAGHSGVEPERIGISFKEIYRAFGTIAGRRGGRESSAGRRCPHATRVEDALPRPRLYLGFKKRTIVETDRRFFCRGSSFL